MLSFLTPLDGCFGLGETPSVLYKWIGEHAQGFLSSKD